MTLGLRLLVIVAFLPVAAQAVTEAERFAAVRRYWEWSAYWRIEGLDFPVARYQPGKSFRALLFFDAEVGDDPFWGFCSKQLGVCQAYRSWEDQTVYEASGTRIRNLENEVAALKRFERQEFYSDAEAKETVFHLGSAKAPPMPPGRLGQRPGADISATARYAREYHLETATRVITLPRLGLPEAVTRKLSNTRVEQTVRDDLRPSSPPVCTVTVPFADEHYPVVPVLYDCPRNRGIQFLRRQFANWTFTAGGWITDPETVRRFTARIQKNASLTLRE